jgi:hypothetical protein
MLAGEPPETSMKEARGHAAQEFSARIRKLGINPCVIVPAKVVEALLELAGRYSGPVQVKAGLNGFWFDATVVRYLGAWRLYLNTGMRKSTGTGVGDRVRVSLRYDPVARMPPMPKALRAALADNPRAKERWRLQTRSRRKEILAYLNSLKTQAGVERNVSKVLRILGGIP